MEIWAVKDISKVEGIIEELDTEGNYVVEEEIYNRLNKNNSSDNFIKKEEVYGHLTEK
ncbi:MAG: hypothetical protein LBQ24_01335 [Candidatus Peribacteria bacterium]|jgi:hypothetical protein|nr:hypothetical protein [Candidatus Peribacteria bacterium]